MNLASFILLALKISIFLNVVAIGLKASTRDALYLSRHPKRLFLSLLSMFVIMPAVAASLVIIFDLNPALKIALVALSLAPVPPILPRKVLMTVGNEPYVIGLLATSCLLAIIYIPLALLLIQSISGIPVGIPALIIAKVVFVTALIPLVVGILIKRRAPKLADRLVKPVATLGLILLLSAVPILFIAWPELKSLLGNGTLVAIAAFTLIGLFAGHVLGGPRHEDRTVLAFSTASRHPAVAIAIAHVNFPNQKPAIAAILLYLVVSLIVSIPYQIRAARHAAHAGTGTPAPQH